MVLNLKEQKLHLQPLSRVEEKGITSLRKRRCINSRLRPLYYIKEIAPDFEALKKQMAELQQIMQRMLSMPHAIIQVQGAQPIAGPMASSTSGTMPPSTLPHNGPSPAAVGSTTSPLLLLKEQDQQARATEPIHIKSLLLKPPQTGPSSSIYSGPTTTISLQSGETCKWFQSGGPSLVAAAAAAQNPVFRDEKGTKQQSTD